MQNRRFTRLSLIPAAAILLIVPSLTQGTSAQSIDGDVMLVNVKTAKCATIAGGVSTDNNVEAVQFTCDSDPSRSWRLNAVDSKVFQVENVQTNKCLTIAGGESTDNNVHALQFDCDGDPSRTWRINDVGGNGEVQIRNVKTSKCLTVAGGTSDANNLVLVQFSCDSDPSRRWTVRRKL